MINVKLKLFPQH